MGPKLMRDGAGVRGGAQTSPSLRQGHGERGSHQSWMPSRRRTGIAWGRCQLFQPPLEAATGLRAETCSCSGKSGQRRAGTEQAGLGGSLAARSKLFQSARVAVGSRVPRRGGNKGLTPWQD